MLNINQTIANYHGNKRREAIQQQEEASAHNPPGYIQRIRRLPRIERDQMIAEQARLEQMTSRTTTSDLPPPYQPTSGRDQPPSYAFVESQANQPRQTPPSNSATTRSVSPLAQGSGREGGGERED